MLYKQCRYFRHKKGKQLYTITQFKLTFNLHYILSVKIRIWSWPRWAGVWPNSAKKCPRISITWWTPVFKNAAEINLYWGHLFTNALYFLWPLLGQTFIEFFMIIFVKLLTEMFDRQIIFVFTGQLKKWHRDIIIIFWQFFVDTEKAYFLT